MGQLVNSTITKSYSTMKVEGSVARHHRRSRGGEQFNGSITDSYMAGSVSGTQFVGGIVGQANGGQGGTAS